MKMTKKAKCITLDKDLVEKVENKAKKESRNFSNTIELILKMYFRYVK